MKLSSPCVEEVEHSTFHISLMKSDIDHTDDSSDNDESVDDFPRQSGSAFQLVDRPQHSLERVPDAFQAAVEDPMQPCSPMSAAAIDRRTEFFALSPS